MVTSRRPKARSAPAWARLSAIALPRPRAAPVTKAVRPLKSKLANSCMLKNYTIAGSDEESFGPQLTVADGLRPFSPPANKNASLPDNHTKNPEFPKVCCTIALQDPLKATKPARRRMGHKSCAEIEAGHGVRETTLESAQVVTLVQAFDSTIGALAYDPTKTYGPFVFAVLNALTVASLLHGKGVIPASATSGTQGKR